MRFDDACSRLVAFLFLGISGLLVRVMGFFWRFMCGVLRFLAQIALSMAWREANGQADVGISGGYGRIVMQKERATMVATDGTT